MIKYTTGNLIDLAFEGHFDVIVHGCNCMHTFGAGIAKEIKTRIPQAYQADLKTDRADHRKLGTLSACKSEGFLVVNAYTQYGYGTGRVQIDYNALRKAFKLLAEKVPVKMRIGVPRIGSGLAGGDPVVIENIIKEEMINHNVTIVNYKG